MIDLAQHDNGEFISLKDVSQRQDITVKYLEQIVSSLSKAGLIRSQRGNNGGYRLTRLPSEYRIGDILRVMEGPLEPISCLMDDPILWPRSDSCATLPFWKGLGKIINEYVDSFTLQDLI